MFSPGEPATASFPYRIEAKIGEGAMGVVYRAIEPSLNRPVAIKFLRKEILENESKSYVEETRQRFQQEARAAAALSHPGVTVIYRVGTKDGIPYIAMEWLEGQTLDKLLRGGPLPVPVVVRLGTDLLEALDAAHRAGVVHRDIKPSNLVLLADGRLKVADFGIARVKGSNLVRTEVGTIVASPRFASPEQLRGEEVDGRSDLFSVGVVLYLALTAKLPFPGQDIMELVTSIIQRSPQPLTEIDPSIPKALEVAILKALSKEPAQRYSRAAEMAAALRQATMEPPPDYQHHMPDPDTSPLITMDTHEGSEEDDDVDDLLARAAEEAIEPERVVMRLPADPQQIVVQLVESWPSRQLGMQATEPLLDRLLETPLHAPPFEGGLFLGRICLIVHEGWILGAVDPETGGTGDEVAERLPKQAVVSLHPLPENLSPSCLPMVASLLGPPKIRHEGLESSFVNLPALGQKLAAEEFDGYIRLERDHGAGVGFILYDRGRPLLSLYAKGWEDVPVEQSWQSWVNQFSIRASVAEKSARPATMSYRRELKDAEFDVEGGGTSSAALVPVRGLEGRVRHGRTLEALCAADVVYKLAQWTVSELARAIDERKRAGRWKALMDGLNQARSCVLHHELSRPGTRASDFFDLVVFGADGRPVVVAERVARGARGAMEQLIERVTQARAARGRTGDIGAAILLSKAFDEEALQAYATIVRADASTSWLASVTGGLSSQDGFVRAGGRNKGFHLLLVKETPAGGFEPILPAV